MNRKSKVIVSIVGITVVLLALLGITYAYYLTRIEGNTNSNSISITTADLKLKYNDGTVNVLTKEGIVPDNDNPVGTKDFSVTNIGNNTIDNYSVVLEYAVLEDVKPSVFKYPNDFEINLSCIDNEGNECNSAKVKFNNEAVTLVTSSIEPNVTHNYTLEIYYHETGIDQSDDMGKNLNLKVQIYEVKETIDIKGKLSGINEDYSVVLNSNPKISPVVKNIDGTFTYSFSGVEIGAHTLKVLNKNGEEVSRENIIINKGNDVGFSTTMVDGKEVLLITINEFNRVANITTSVDVSQNIVENSGTSVSLFNPYDGNKDSLAYNILNNSILNKNGTILVDTPSNKVGEEPSRNRVYVGESHKLIIPTEYDLVWNFENTWHGEESLNYGNYIVEENYLYYGVDYPLWIDDCQSINLKNKVYTNESKKELRDLLAGKYIVFGNSNSGIVYKVSPDTSYDINEGIHYALATEITLVDSSTSGYAELSLTPDDNGMSYYYRGGAIDNYVEFDNMCFRIVRIEGDGSIKLMLAKDGICSSGSLYDDSSIIKEYVNYGHVYDQVYVLTDKDGNKIDVIVPPIYNESIGLKKYLTEWFNTKFREDGLSSGNLTSFGNKIKKDKWCLGGKHNFKYLRDYEENNLFDSGLTVYPGYYQEKPIYAATQRLNSNKVSLKCTKEEDYDVSFIGALTVDEVIFSGLSKSDYGYSYIGDNVNSLNVLLLSYKNERSAYGFKKSYNEIDSNTGFVDMQIDLNEDRGYDTPNEFAVVPVITLKSGITIFAGDGTIRNPYKIN